MNPIFEGHSGFFKQVSGPANVDVDTFGRRGVPFRIHQCSLKAYPAVIYTQTAIVAGIEVAKEVGSLDRIAAIEIATTRRGFERTGSEPEKWSLQTRETADHSLPYITARAMFDGDITNESSWSHHRRISGGQGACREVGSERLEENHRVAINGSNPNR